MQWFALKGDNTDATSKRVDVLDAAQQLVPKSSSRTAMQSAPGTFCAVLQRGSGPAV